MPPRKKRSQNEKEEEWGEVDDFGENEQGPKILKSQKIETHSLIASAASVSGGSSDPESFFLELSTTLTLKPDHETRPIWIASSNLIILEAFSKYYNQAYDFLIDIAEPISRPTYFQTYKLTEDSLYSAVAVSRSTESIIKYLNMLCKTDIPTEVIDFIRSSTSTFGKVNLLLSSFTKQQSSFSLTSKFYLG